MPLTPAPGTVSIRTRQPDRAIWYVRGKVADVVDVLAGLHERILARRAARANTTH